MSVDRGTVHSIDLEHENPDSLASLYSFWAINNGLMSSDESINTGMSLMSTLTVTDLMDYNHPKWITMTPNKRCGSLLIPNKVGGFDSWWKGKDESIISLLFLPELHFNRRICLVSHWRLRPVEATVQESSMAVGSRLKFNQPHLALLFFHPSF